ncbi:MAG TPA: sn-glycerol-3-phosphate ABC transporter ATP-binding protein UgpC, partial [Acidimicrobiales bacterium]|nr:sn-glycerol-3-phosphate ABC transporter ATP-binding protein UgpC [Acidimicrobiales bacterium]
MAEVVLDDVSKVYGDGTKAVADLDLSIGDGEFMVLVGPSGCGKTTALRMVAGLEDISAGEVRVGGKVVNDVPPKDRDIAMVFQSYALYPHLSVFENIAFGLRLRKVPKDEVERRVREAARILDLEELLKRKPRALSGGQRQRVAMGRAIVREPQAFLMDEPLSNLDAKLRVQMRAEIGRIQDNLGVTTIYVTHDQTEAMTLGDRVAVMRKGVLQQVATPQELYDDPVNLFVAGFIGSPAMNLLEATLDDDGGGWSLRLGSQRLRLDDRVVADRPPLAGYRDRAVAAGIRPEDMEDAALAADAPADRRLSVTTDLVEAMGSDVYVHFGLDAPPVVTEETRELAEDVDAEQARQLAGARSSARANVVARCSPRTAARPGQRLELVVDTSRFHFFDLGTGASIGGGGDG